MFYENCGKKSKHLTTIGFQTLQHEQHGYCIIIELSLAPQIRHNSSKSLYKAFISEVHVLWLRSNVEVMYLKMVTKAIGLEVTSYVKVR